MRGEMPGGAPIWGRHLEAAPDEAMVRFCAGRDVTPLPMADAELLPFDLWTNRAHVIMLGRQGILDSPTMHAALDGFAELEAEWSSGRFQLDPMREDVHINVEYFVSQRKGSAVGGCIHTGRSRNDQVGTDMRLYLRAACLELAEAVGALAFILLDQAEAYAETLMPGFTHTQPAMATTWGHWLSAHAQALCRDLERIRLAYEICNRSPLGAAAGLGTSWPIDRELTAILLGFSRVEANTLDAISARWEAEWQVASTYAGLMAHLAVMAQDLVMLSHPYWGMVRLADAYVTGSSIMPQKRNPDLCEVIRGKSAWTIGQVTALLAVPKGAMSGYNRDTQITKYAALDIVRECQAAPIVMRGAFEALTIHPETMRRRLNQGFLGAADFADMLARQLALPFREAYHIAAAAVGHSGTAERITAAAAEMAIREAGHEVTMASELIKDLTDPTHPVPHRQHTGAPAPTAVRVMVSELRSECQSLQAFVPEQRAIIQAAYTRCRDYPQHEAP